MKVEVINLGNGNREFIISIIAVVVTFVFSFLTFKLQIQQNHFEKKQHELEKRIHCNNIYYFLSSLITNLGELDIDRDTLQLNSTKVNRYLDDIYYLEFEILNKNEVDFLTTLVSQYDGFCSGKETTLHKIKVMYNMVIDKYIEPTEINKLRAEYKIEESASIYCLVILYKLRKAMNMNIDCKSINITDNRRIFKITKNYKLGKYITYSNNEINGDVCEYEKVFYGDKKTTTYEIIYDGPIEKSKKSGEAKYYYYTMGSDFNSGLNSISLCERNVNHDANAMKMTKILNMNGVTNDCNAIFEGSFKEDEIFKGKITYRLSKNDKEKTIIV